ncbi:hypothetical protein ACWGJT_28240 [Streptomyces xantholiticus]
MKTRSAFKSAQWHAGAPDHVTAQVLWQIAVNGYEHTHYAVLQTVCALEARLAELLGNQG